ncbi:MAG: PorT family protein [Bacteroidetes bacterium]|nr:PorT family protein [Bacteroidota bacterium]
MNKHTIISFILFAIISLNVNAQRWDVPNLSGYDNDPFHYGFLLGINQMDFSIQKIDPNPGKILPSGSTGFTIGIVSSFRLTDNFHLRIIPSLSFGSKRILEYSFAKKEITSTFLEVPLILRYKGWRINNAQPFIQTGLKYAFDLHGVEDNTTSPLKLKKSDIYGVLGVGFDFYFDWFKMGVEGTMNYGLNDILDRTSPTQYVDGITSLRSKIFQISVTFE